MTVRRVTGAPSNTNIMMGSARKLNLRKSGSNDKSADMMKPMTTKRKMVFGKKGRDFTAAMADAGGGAGGGGGGAGGGGGGAGGTVPEAKPSETKIGEENMREETMATLGKCLIEHKWYHGVMPRDEINSMLQTDGDFLVRKTTEKNRPFICLSVKHGPDCRHFPLLYENGVWFVKNLSANKKFFELVELLDYLILEKKPLGESNAVLVRAIPRPDYYILHEDITLICKLGSGAFGEVWKGSMRRAESGTKLAIDVAVKKMKGNPTKAITSEFVKEAKLMRQLQHRNIVRVYGVAPNEEPLMIVLELAANGCLKSYVQKNNCPVEQLMQFSSDAARGMAFLASKWVIHRDLAARNLLLGSKVEVKISDFGLSEAGKREVKVNKMKLPIRWLAPETIDTGVFTTKTDVWSFAVTLWEIFAKCATDPFPGLTNQQAKEKIRKSTPPMQAPPETPSSVVRMMLDCFEKKPDARPTFPQILKKFCPNEDVTIYEMDEQNTQEHISSEVGSKTAKNKTVTIKDPKEPSARTKAKQQMYQINHSTRVLKLAPLPATNATNEEQLADTAASHSLAPPGYLGKQVVTIPPRLLINNVNSSDRKFKKS